MKTCLKYWGGKQQLADRIIALFPAHSCYVEPFFGGGAVFFRKSKVPVEIINDVNDNIINFYRVIKRDFEKLKDEVDVTLYSESQWRQAKELWESGMEKDKVLRAWAAFVLSHQSFSGSLGGSWAFSDTRNWAAQFKNVKDYFDAWYVQRLDGVQIFCRDALDIIGNVDSPETFYFIDPPYFNADMGHYGGYTQEQFEQLLEVLSGIKGKFFLTTYPSEILRTYVDRFNWHTVENELFLSASNTPGKTKTEVFTFNYEPPVEQTGLFD
jgi:DNA adenine methylase